MACPRCGGNFPETSSGGLCNSCRWKQVQADAAASRRESEKERGSSKSAPIALDPRVATVICILLGIALVIGAIWLVMSIHNDRAEEMTMETFTETLSGDGAAVAAEVLTREDGKSNWSIHVTDYKKGFFGTLFGLKGDTATIDRYLQADGTEVIAFDFDGYDFDTGLQGEYYILTVEGKISVIDDKAELIYQEGSDFFDTNYPKLKALTYDQILTPLTEKVVGDRYGKNEQYPHILQANGWELAIFDEKRAIFSTDTDDLRTQYVADVDDVESNYTFEMLNYKLYGEEYEGLDELGKLMADGDYSVSIEKYVDGQEVLDLRYERNLKQHSFEVEADCGDFKVGTYVLTPGEETFVHRTYNPETYATEDAELSVAENQALYDALTALVPENYVRSVMDLSKAKKAGALGINTYTMKDADGNTTATLSVAFGKINKLIHFVSDDERIEMAW